ncbi:hypothetical protein [Streptococcus intermedius]|uniref:hypothetical protein n=1 Tax=Streptococcus intermedius TaxID=1338 RepID=UPI000F68E0CD|nr:hypothetical protein [Streptococcus intermedius]RSJ18728.1 hypothetical protein D8829_09455 [Streptococcus intermedius]
MKYTEYQRMQIAQQEYESYEKGQELTIDNKMTTIGTVVDVIDQSDNGLHMTVVKEPDICITLQDKQFCLFYSII